MYQEFEPVYMAPPVPQELKVPHQEAMDEKEQRILASLRDQIRLYYRPSGIEEGEMPFHGIDHPLDAEQVCIQLCDYAEQNGLKIDRFAVQFAILTHDLYYHREHEQESERLKAQRQIRCKFSTKEDMHAWFAGNLAESYGVDKQRISKIKRLIRKTNLNATPRTAEEKIVVRSDLSNIAGPSESFLANALCYIREEEMLTGVRSPFERIAAAHDVLRAYVSKDLCLGDFDRDVYQKTFRQPALANIARLSTGELQRTIMSLGQKAIRLLPSLGQVIKQNQVRIA